MEFAQVFFKGFEALAALAERHRRRALAAPAIVALFLYMPALGHGLVWDDRHYLVALPFHDWTSMWRWAFEPFFGLYFRPLALLMLGTEQLLAGGPAISHAVSILIFAANISLVTRLGRLIALQARTADAGSATMAGVLSGLLYALHPAAVESVAWISGRFDLLVTFFCLLMLWLDRYVTLPGLRATAVAAVFLCAMLSKEMAACMVLILPLWHRLFAPGASGWHDPATRSQYAGIIVVALGYLVLRQTFAGDAATAADALNAKDVLGHAAFVLRTLGGYVLLMLWPLGQIGPIHSYLAPSPLIALQTAAGALALIAAGAAVWKSRNPPFGVHLLGACSIAALVLVLNIVPLALGDSFFQDRLACLPLALAALWAGSEITGRAALAQRAAAIALVAVWLLAAAVQTAVVIPAWKDNTTLWARVSAQHPDSWLALYNLQTAYMESARYIEARDLSRRLVEQFHGQLPAQQWLTYASALYSTGDPQAALQALASALSAAPENAKTMRAKIYCKSGEIFLNQAVLDSARGHLLKAVDLDPANPEALFYLAVLSLATGDTVHGEAYLQMSLEHADPALAAQERIKAPEFAEVVRNNIAHPAGD